MTVFLRLRRTGQMDLLTQFTNSTIARLIAKHTTTSSTAEQAAVEMDSFCELSRVVSPPTVTAPSLSSSRRLPYRRSNSRYGISMLKVFETPPCSSIASLLGVLSAIVSRN
nr:hypothetical protein Itr_chr08CG10720 [Ipomoea trifida]